MACESALDILSRAASMVDAAEQRQGTRFVQRTKNKVHTMGRSKIFGVFLAVLNFANLMKISREYRDNFAKLT